MEINAVVIGFTVVLLVGLPLLTVREDVLEEALRKTPDRRPLYISGALSLALVAGATFGVIAWWQDIPAADVGWIRGDFGVGMAWAVGVTVAGLGGAWLVSGVIRGLGMPESRVVLLLLPRTPGERTWFVFLALAAGVCEEYVYRGVALHVLEAWTGNVWVAVAVTSLSFGLAHGYQRLAGIVRATALGVILALPVVWTGSIFPAVAAHFWINAIIGLGGWRWMVPGDQLPELDLEEEREEEEADTDAGEGGGS